jgi:hypothetical protein
LDHVDGALRFGEKVVLVGRNGTGKSTLFRLALGQETPDTGTVALGARVEVGYLAQLDYPTEAKTVLQLFCEEAALETGVGRSRLARYLFYGEDVFKLVHQLSGGEWTRLRLAQPAEQLVSPPAPAPPRDRARKPIEADKRAQAKVEERIKQLEQLLGELDADLAKAQASADLARLSAGWVEREQAQQELDRCYAEWVELDGGPSESQSSHRPKR